jgi:hypothetical protein
MCESEYTTLNELFDRYAPYPLGNKPLPSPGSSFADTIVIGHQLSVMGDDTAADLREGLQLALTRALENAHPHLSPSS